MKNIWRMKLDNTVTCDPLVHKFATPHYDTTWRCPNMHYYTYIAPHGPHEVNTSVWAPEWTPTMPLYSKSRPLQAWLLGVIYRKLTVTKIFFSYVALMKLHRFFTFQFNSKGPTDAHMHQQALGNNLFSRTALIVSDIFIRHRFVRLVGNEKANQ